MRDQPHQDQDLNQVQDQKQKQLDMNLVDLGLNQV